MYVRPTMKVLVDFKDTFSIAQMSFVDVEMVLNVCR
jgi:hypothetical protein